MAAWWNFCVVLVFLFGLVIVLLPRGHSSHSSLSTAIHNSYMAHCTDRLFLDEDIIAVNNVGMVLLYCFPLFGSARRAVKRRSLPDSDVTLLLSLALVVLFWV